MPKAGSAGWGEDAGASVGIVVPNLSAMGRGTAA